MSATCTSSSAWADQRNGTKQKCRHHLCGITMFTDLCKAMNQYLALHEQNTRVHIRVGVFERTVVVWCLDLRGVEDPALFFLEEQLRGCKHTSRGSQKRGCGHKTANTAGSYDSPPGGSLKPKKLKFHWAALKYQLDFWNIGGICKYKCIIVCICSY